MPAEQVYTIREDEVGNDPITLRTVFSQHMGIQTFGSRRPFAGPLHPKRHRVLWKSRIRCGP